MVDSTVVVALAGIASTAAVSVLTPVIGWWSESKKLDKAHEQALELADVEHKREQLREWRTGVVESLAKDPHSTKGETFSGTVWFESLRPYLGSEVTANGSSTPLREDLTIMVDVFTAGSIFEEINRLEREWFPPLDDG